MRRSYDFEKATLAKFKIHFGEETSGFSLSYSPSENVCASRYIFEIEDLFPSTSHDVI